MPEIETSPYSLQGKVALVTGAARGIGLACATTFARQGAAVMMTDIHIEPLKTACKDLQKEGYQSFYQEQDVSREGAWEDVMATISERFDGLDVLVNNAGIYTGDILLNNDLEQLRDTCRHNVESIFLGMKYAAAYMRKDRPGGRGGSIINLSSVAGLIGVPGHSSYGATKGAVRSYSKHAAVEFAVMGYGIRVNSVHPGVIDTEMGDKVYQDFVDIGMAADHKQAKQMILNMIPAGCVGSVQDVANMVLFLASDASSYVTGAEFVVDGGMTAA